MDNKSIFFKLNKEVFFNTVNFKDNSALLNAVKNDWHRSTITLNGIKQTSYVNFLELLTREYTNYLTNILLICTQNAHFTSYNKIFEIISKYDYHFQTDKLSDEKVTTNITLSPLIKQGTVTNTYDIFKIEGNAKYYRKIKVSTIIDFSTVDPVMIKIEYLD